MANSINSEMMNLLTHLLKTVKSEELNAMQHSPYVGDDDLINSNVHDKYRRFELSKLSC